MCRMLCYNHDLTFKRQKNLDSVMVVPGHKIVKEEITKQNKEKKVRINWTSVLEFYTILYFLYDFVPVMKNALVQLLMQ